MNVLIRKLFKDRSVIDYCCEGTSFISTVHFFFFFTFYLKEYEVVMILTLFGKDGKPKNQISSERSRNYFVKTEHFQAK